MTIDGSKTKRRHRGLIFARAIESDLTGSSADFEARKSGDEQEPAAVLGGTSTGSTGLVCSELHRQVGAER
jgi:hypothetical protein